MADSTTTIQINLRSTADTSGVRQTVDALKQVNGEAARQSGNVAAASQSLDALHGAQNRAAGSGRNMGNAMLQASRGIQDMQYGLAGAVNNLEGIASALGLGAGVAGVVTVLAVILQQTGPKIAEFFRSLDTNQIKTAGIDALIKQLGSVPEPMSHAEISAKKFETQTDANNDAIKRLNETLDNNLKLLALQASALRSEADFKTEQAVQDIKAQKLDPAAEAAAIANVRTKGAETKKQIADQEAIDKLNNAANKREDAQNAASAAEARAAREEQILRNTEKQRDLLIEQKRLEADLATQQENAAKARAAGFNDPAIAAGVAEAQDRLAKNAAAQAAVGPVGDIAALGGENGTAAQARKDALAKRAAADALSRDAAQLANEERLKADERARELARERERINREAAPGVYNPANRVEPASPFGPAPLPSGRRFAPGEQPPNPFGLPQPLPAAGTAPGAQPASPFGPAPLPQLDAAPLSKTAESITKANETTARFAETVVKKTSEIERKLAALETKMKNSRA